jgi:hypothetical protein
VVKPVGEEKGFKFVEGSVVKDEEELASIGTESLDGVRDASGKQPEISFGRR